MSYAAVLAETLRALGVQLVGAGLGVQLIHTANSRKQNARTQPLAIGLIAGGAISIAMGLHLSSPNLNHRAKP